MSTILIVDDEQDIRDLVGIYIKNEGYEIKKAASGNEALSILNEQDIDLAILDVMMPDMDGLTLCVEIRKKSHIPIIMLSAKDQDMDKVMGLTVGADDYVSKPFNPIELIARVKAQLRRNTQFNDTRSSSSFEYLDLKIDYNSRRVTIDSKPIMLTPKEYAILELFCKNRGTIYTTAQIYDMVWKEEEAYDVNNVIMVHIRNIRSKIEKDVKKPEYIKTVWGVGYKFA